MMVRVQAPWRVWAAVCVTAALVVVSIGHGADSTWAATASDGDGDAGVGTVEPSTEPAGEPQQPSATPSVEPSAGPDVDDDPAPTLEPSVAPDTDEATGDVEPADPWEGIEPERQPAPPSSRDLSPMDYSNAEESAVITGDRPVAPDEGTEVIVVGQWDADATPTYVEQRQHVGDLPVEVDYRSVLGASGVDVAGVMQAVEVPGRDPARPQYRARMDLLAEEYPAVAVGDQVIAHTIVAGVSEAIPGASMAVHLQAADAGTRRVEWAEFGFDASGLLAAHGAEYLSRVTVMQFPACALTTPEVPQCREGVPMRTVVDPSGVVTATLPVEPQLSFASPGTSGVAPTVAGGPLVTALQAAYDVAGANGRMIASPPTSNSIAVLVGQAAGPAGDFTATDLSPVGSWSVTEQTGGFTYSVPLPVPTVAAGPVPALSLDYSSQVVDGRNIATNNQAGLVGDGWSLTSAFIEREYKSCVDDYSRDHSDSFDFDRKYGDLCLEDRYGTSDLSYIISLNGTTSRLISDGGGRYYPEFNPDWRVTRVVPGSGAALQNGDNNNEYFVLRTPDGGVYYFGFGHAPAVAGTADAQRVSTQSVATVPVYGDDADDPVTTSGAAGSHSVQGYRWMLDVEMDSIGNGVVYYYDQDQGWFASNSDPGRELPYTRAIKPDHIEYGMLLDDFETLADGDEYGPRGRIDFEYRLRCTEDAVFTDHLNGEGADCAEPSLATGFSYPDVPVDLICEQGTCTSAQNAPTFFFTDRLTQISGSVWATGDQAELGWRTVSTTQLVQSFPVTEDRRSKALWLDAVYTRSYDITTGEHVDSAPVLFDGTEMPNRVDWDATSFDDFQLLKRRVTRVINDFGGQVQVEYMDPASASAPEWMCGAGGVATSDPGGLGTPSEADANVTDCYAIPVGVADTQFYRKYLVESVTLHDPIGGADDQVFTYEYLGQPAWAHTSRNLYADGEGRGMWMEWRGFSQVAVTTGSGLTQSTTVNQYFRGLDGDWRDSSTRRDETLTLVVTAEPSDTLPVDDHRALQGYLAATQVKDSQGTVMSESYSTYTVTTADATYSGTAPTLRGAVIVLSKRDVSRTYEDLGGGQVATSTVITEPDIRGENIVSGYETTSRLAIPGQATEEHVVCVDYTTTRNYGGFTGDWTDYFSAASWGGPYIRQVWKEDYYEGACGDTNKVLTSSTDYYFDGAQSDGSNYPTQGLVTRVLTSATESDGAVAEETIRYEATYDERGRASAAWMPNDTDDSSSTSAVDRTDPVMPATVTWGYAQQPDGSTVVTTTRPSDGDDYVTTQVLEPSRGNVVVQEDANGAETYYDYDPAGLLIAAWGGQQALDYEAQQVAPQPAFVAPTVSFEYDRTTDGIGPRNRPVGVLTAPFLGYNDAVDEYECATGVDDCQVRRSYTFYDGFGRVVEQHAVAQQPVDGANGPAAGRVVTATHYNDIGAADWVSAPYTDPLPAQFMPLEGDTRVGPLDSPVMSDLATYTLTTGDPFGRLTTTTLAGTAAPNAQVRTTTSSSGVGWSEQTDALGHTTRVEYDAAGRVERQGQWSGAADASTRLRTTTYDYETATNFSTVTVTDDEGNATVFTSDMAGRRTELDDPNSGTTTYEYDAGGNVVAIDSPAGVLTFEYDVMGRMVQRREGASDVITTWEYADSVSGTAPLGALTQQVAINQVDGATVEVVQSTQSWDVLNRPTATATTVNETSATALLGADLDGFTHTTSVSYDATGAVSGTSLPAMADLSAETITLERNAFGQLATMDVGSETWIEGVQTDALGRLLKREYAGGIIRGFEWDQWDGALERTTVAWSDGGAPVAILDDTFVRDDAGRVTSIVDGVSRVRADGAPASTVARCFDFDDLNRLSSAWTVPGGSDPCAAPLAVDSAVWAVGDGGFWQEWQYSSSGQVEQRTERRMDGTDVWVDTYDFVYGDDAGSSDPGATFHAVTDVAVTSQLATGGTPVAGDAVSFEYDDAGRMTQRTATPAGGTAVVTDVSWDVLSNLVVADVDGTEQVNIYDAAGQRVVRLDGVVGTVYAGSDEIVDPDVTTTGSTLTGTRYYQLGSATVAYRTGGAVTWLFGDVQGSAQVSLPKSGQEPVGEFAAAYAAYGPYGEVLAAGAGFDDIDRGWLGQTQDAGTGWAYLNARHYDPMLGRFLSPDPLMNPGDPRTLDPYRYADNNPVVYTDATGLTPNCGAYASGSAASLGCYANWAKENANSERSRAFQSHVETAAKRVRSGDSLTDRRANARSAGTRAGEGRSQREIYDAIMMEARWLTDRDYRRRSQGSAQNEFDDDTGTSALEIEAGLTAIWKDGAQYYDEGPLCGTTMECFVNANFDYGLITLGHTVLSRFASIRDDVQAHEYQHVLDVEYIGSVIFYPEYGVRSLEALYPWNWGDWYHDANPFEGRAIEAQNVYLATGRLPVSASFEERARNAGCRATLGTVCGLPALTFSRQRGGGGGSGAALRIA